MDLQHKLQEEIIRAFSALFQHKLEEQDLLQPTRKEFEGDFTFVVFPYLKVSKKNPEETAKAIGEYLLANTGFVEKYNVVKGFLNISLKKTVWTQIFKSIFENENHGAGPANAKKVVVEYSSPNTNKPLHLGHMRNIFLGYSVANILKTAGYDVVKINLVNDRGIHICKSMLAYQKFGSGETPESSGIKGDHLIGNYYVRFDQEYKKEIEQLVATGKTKDEAEKEAPILKEAQEMLRKWEEGDEEVVNLWKKMNGWVYEGFNITYDRMGVDFDQYYYESDTYLLGKDIVDEGLKKGVFHKRDDGSVWCDLSAEGLDEKLLLRADGTSVYMTQDLGTADLKYKDYQFDHSIYVVGNEQDYHFQVLFLILKKLGRSYAEGMYHLSYGMVDLPSGKMKSREGTVVDADDLIDEMVDTARRHTEELGKIDGFTPEQAKELYEILALGALKFFLLKVDPKKRMLFNPEDSIQFHGTTGPFIQYTHARISAIVRKAEEMGVDYKSFDISAIENLHETELPIVFLLNQYPEIVAEAAKNYSPSLIAQFAYDLAKEYNRFYTEVSIFKEGNENLLKFKVAFSYTVARTIKSAMGLLGIRVPDRM